MNKTELTNAIAAKAGITKVDAKKALDATIESITEALKAGEKVTLIGFGTFATSERPARQGVNPQTGQTINIAAKKIAKFKAGAELEEAVK
ncbi:MAG: HU family DNA-binding protein [Bacteroidaceae bacterium]|nr:HU family DNA-binding protein [Bacteroidaceae bacterium]